MRLIPAMGLAVLLLAAGQSPGQIRSLTGPGLAVSGTGIVMEDPAGSSVTLRLAGLLSPPEGALCPSAEDGLPDWECGTGSRLALGSAIAGETLECRLLGPVSEEPVPAVCLAQTRNLNIWMLSTGRAVLVPEWRGRNPGWDAAERAARRVRAMLWSAVGR